MLNIHDQRLLIVDFGSQYTQLIARRVRECGVYCEIHPFDIPDAFIREFAPAGVVLSGGPETVTTDQTPRISPAIFDLDVPILGICYGMQALAAQLGGQVEGSNQQEFGYARIHAQEPSRLLPALGLLSETQVDAQVAAGADVWMSHGDKVTVVPPEFDVTAATDSAPIAAMEHRDKPIFGVQFHPEVTHTEQGGALLNHFARVICGCSGTWTAANIVEDAVQRVRHQVGQDRVVLGLSGGVDSSVVAALLARAIGDQLTCIFVDNGLLRKHEREDVERAFAPETGVGNSLPLDIQTVDASDMFLQQLRGVSDPEQKRKLIGGAFIDVFEAEAKKIQGVKWLAQGTIYPDVIESAASKYGKAHVIKSHHNVGGLPERMGLGLVEPLRELFKDEVRQIGLHLGLPHSLIYRHPFPGPGLGVRILGEVSAQHADVLREADHIFIQALRRENYYDSVSQAFAVYLPVKSVGVVGDARRYEHVIALRAVETVDFMTARSARLPYEFIESVANQIINEIPTVSRVVYDVSSKPPATIEWE